MSTPHEGSSSEGKSPGSAHDSTIAPDALPPLPEAVKAPAAPELKPHYSFLAPPKSLEELGRLKKFRVLRLLGKGGMGMVFLAEDTMLHRHVALKVMLPELAANQEAATRFLREARATAKIRHDCIVTLYDVDEAEGVPFLVMELLEGLTLHEFLRHGKRLTPVQAARIGREMASGLAAAHRHGVIHRDIKPGNIWLEKPAGQVKILDFGLARIQTPDQMSSSVSGGLLGTPAYMSPEQALGQPIDARSDLFSLGTVLYQLCTSRLPFAGDTLFALLESIARLPHKPVLAWHPAVPAPVAELIHHLLEKRPEDRPQNALVVAERLEEILSEWPATEHQISAVLLAPRSAAPPKLQGRISTEDDTGPAEIDITTPPESPPGGQRRTPPPPLPTPQAPIPAIEVPSPQRSPRPPAPPSSWPPSRPRQPEAHRRRGLPKAWSFGLLGGLGCLVAAMLFEAPLRWLLPASTSLSGSPAAAPAFKVDAVVVFDATDTMKAYLETVRSGVPSILVHLQKNKLDARIGVVSFRDRVPMGIDGKANDTEDPKQLAFDGGPFTSDPEALRREFSGINPSGGGDLPESSLDALDAASTLPFRPGAVKVLILITDGPPHVPDKDNADATVLAQKLKARGIHQVHLFVPDAVADNYAKVQRILGGDDRPAGKVFSIDALRDERRALEKHGDDLENALAAQITQFARGRGATRAVCTEGTYLPADWAKTLFAIALWAAFIAQGLTLALIVSSMLYLGQALRRIVSVLNGCISIVIGLVAGASAQGLITLLTMGVSSGIGAAILDLIAKVVGWTILGAFVGLGLGFFLPNLSKAKGLSGGALGGLFGALFYVVFSALLGEMLGRWLAALALGFCVGLFVALVERAFRRWWLEVRNLSGQVRTVTLGPEIISIGSDPGRATVVLQEGPAVAYRYFLDGQRVMCEDARGSFEIHPGDMQRIGATSVVLCSPDSVGELGVFLALSNGRSIPLSEGLPLTGEDLPGLDSTQTDGTVALVSPKGSGDLLLLANRSQQQWKVTDSHGKMRIIDPGAGVTLAPGTQIDFGRTRGRFLAAQPDREDETGILTDNPDV